MGAALAAAATIGALIAGFGSVSRAPPPTLGSLATRSSSRPSAEASDRTLPTVRTLFEQKASAYHARLFADEEGVVLTTPAGFTLVRADAEAEEHALSLGSIALRHGAKVIFWRAGKLRDVSIYGGDERELVSVARAPQYLLAATGQLAWISTDRAGAALETLSKGQTRVVYASAHRVSAPSMHGAEVFWVETQSDGSWNFARIGLNGEYRKANETHHERVPALLVPGQDGVYFYAGPRRGVRKLTFDFESETAIATGAVCSPLVVSSRVVCAQVGGLFEVLPSGSARFLASERAGPITGLAATATRVYWVAESGDERLVVRALDFPAF
jgi:hypothetical protein